MNFLRTLFWIVLTAVVVVLARNNWFTVTVNLFGGLLADVQLPVLLGIAFLLGLVPTWLYFAIWRWRERRRADAAAVSPAMPVTTASADEPDRPR